MMTRRRRRRRRAAAVAAAALGLSLCGPVSPAEARLGTIDGDPLASIGRLLDPELDPRLISRLAPPTAATDGPQQRALQRRQPCTKLTMKCYLQTPQGRRKRNSPSCDKVCLNQAFNRWKAAQRIKRKQNRQDGRGANDNDKPEPRDGEGEIKGQLVVGEGGSGGKPVSMSINVHSTLNLYIDFDPLDIANTLLIKAEDVEHGAAHSVRATVMDAFERWDVVAWISELDNGRVREDEEMEITVVEKDDYLMGGQGGSGGGGSGGRNKDDDDDDKGRKDDDAPPKRGEEEEEDTRARDSFNAGAGVDNEFKAGAGKLERPKGRNADVDGDGENDSDGEDDAPLSENDGNGEDDAPLSSLHRTENSADADADAGDADAGDRDGDGDGDGDYKDVIVRGTPDEHITPIIEVDDADDENEVVNDRDGDDAGAVAVGGASDETAAPAWDDGRDDDGAERADAGGGEEDGGPRREGDDADRGADGRDRGQDREDKEDEDDTTWSPAPSICAPSSHWSTAVYRCSLPLCEGGVYPRGRFDDTCHVRCDDQLDGEEGLCGGSGEGCVRFVEGCRRR